MRYFGKTGTMVFTAFLLPLVTPVSTPLAQGLSQAARDWWVTCNDELYCIAEVSGTSSTDPDMKLKLERSNKPDNKIFVTVQTGIELQQGMRVDISVLGLDFEVGGDISKIYKGNEMAFAETPDSSLLANLRKGAKGQVTVRYGGDTGTVVYDVSLTGITTALLIMDEAQRRLDRVDAAIASGGEPSSSLSPARDTHTNGDEDQSVATLEAPDSDDTNPPIGDFSTDIGSGGLFYSANELPEAVIMPGYRTLGCDMEGPIQGYGARAAGAGNGNVVYLVPCNSGDVNIEHYVAMTGPRHGSFAETYEFELPPDFNEPNRATLINPQFDAQSGTLTSTTYSSPAYDCGVFEKFRYVPEQDFFELIEYREKTDCDGVTGLPENFPLVWTLDEMGQ